MDRTLLVSYKEEERELGKIVYNKLKMLSLINAPSEEFKALFSENMFLKPNHQAFFQIMHFLFITYDPIEFKKRFYWPLVDKKSESIFRSATVDYLIELNNKFNLKWTQLKNYIVIMPGGKRFLTFLNDFIDFISKQLIIKKEKHLRDKKYLNNLTFEKAAFLKMKQQNQCLKVNSMRYFHIMDKQTEILTQKILIIKNIEEMLNFKYLLTDPLRIESYSKYYEQIYNQNINNKIKKISDTGKSILIMKDAFQNYINQKCDVTFYEKPLQLRNSINKELFSKNAINANALFKSFEETSFRIQNSIMSVNRNLLEKLFFEEGELSKLKTSVIQLDNDITKYTKYLNTNMNVLEIIKKTPQKFSYHPNDISKFIKTPPIITSNKITIKPRLALMSDFMNNLSITNISHNDYFSFAKNQTTLMQQDVNKNMNNHYKDISVHNSSKIFSASALLRSLKKSKTNRYHEKRTGSMENYEGKSNVVIDEKTLKETSLFATTSFSNNIQKRVLFLQHILNSPKNLSKTPDNLSKKKSTIDYIQGTSDFARLSTSPSGRLESLIDINLNILPNVTNNDMNFSNITDFCTNDRISDINEQTSIVVENILDESDSILHNVPI